MKIGSRIPGHIRRLRPCAIGGHTLLAGQGVFIGTSEQTRDSLGD
jgi:hypothetical protein